MDLIIIVVRIAITLTFLILAIFGPFALVKLNTFIKRYSVAHEALEARVAALERLAGIKCNTETP